MPVRIISGNHRRIWYLMIKLVLLATLITVLYNFEVSLSSWPTCSDLDILLTQLLVLFQAVFEKMFMLHPIKPLFIMKDNTVHEWWFRWWLDRYVSI